MEVNRMTFEFTGKTKEHKGTKLKEVKNTKNGSVFWLAESAAFPDENVVFKGTCMVFEKVSLKGNISVENCELLFNTTLLGDISLKDSIVGPCFKMENTYPQNKIHGEITNSKISNSTVLIGGKASAAPNSTSFMMEIKSSEIRNTEIDINPENNKNNLFGVSDSVFSAYETNISLSYGGSLFFDKTNISGKTVSLYSSGKMFFDSCEILADEVSINSSQKKMSFSRCQISKTSEITSFLSDADFSDCIVSGEVVCSGGNFNNVSFCGTFKSISTPIIKSCYFGKDTVYDDVAVKNASTRISDSKFSGKSQVLFQGDPEASYNLYISGSVFCDDTKLIVSKGLKIIDSQCSEHSIIESSKITNSKIYGYANIFKVNLENCVACGSAMLGFTADGKKIEENIPYDKVPCFSDRTFYSKDEIVFVKIKREGASSETIRSVLVIDKDGCMGLFGRDHEEHVNFKSILDEDIKTLIDLIPFRNIPALQFSKRQLDSFLYAISSDIIQKYMLNISIDIVFILLKLHYVCMLYNESLLSGCVFVDQEKYKFYWNLLDDTGSLDDCSKIFDMFNRSGVVDIASKKVVRYQYKMIVPELVSFALSLKNKTPINV